MDNNEIAHILERIGKLLELAGDNPFKARAYYTAAREISALEGKLDSPEAERRLPTIRGVGEALEKKILELIRTGKIQYLEDLEKKLSPDILEMLRIPGLGPRKLRSIIDTLGVGSVGELEYACLENRIRLMKGFGEKSQHNILKGIELVKRSRGSLLFPDAMSRAERFRERIIHINGISQAVIAGSLRRRSETVNEISLAVETSDGVFDEAARAEIGIEFQGKSAGENGDILTGMLEHDMKCRLTAAAAKSFPILLHHATGSSEYLNSLREYAQTRGFRLEEKTLTRDGQPTPVASEPELFEKLGLEFIPPELRENRGEIDAARNQSLPRLIEPEDIRGILHVHTVWSDGSNTIEEMALAAKAMGMQYLGITDHSVSAPYAGGLTVEGVKRQWEEIERLNSRNMGIFIFKGIECDIRADGALDYDDSLLDGFDFVIASVHSRFKMERGEMTDRIIRAISHPRISMLGHPTGRLLLARDPYAADVERIIEACADYGAALELNADPHRFDLDWRWHRFASSRGIKISINPDAHSMGGLSSIYYGVNIARKGWLRREDALNAMPLEKIRETMIRKKTQRA